MSDDSIIGMLRGVGSQPEPAPKKKRPEAQTVQSLTEFFESYNGGCRFKPGDLVTPKAGTIVMGEGEPHIVLEVLSEPLRVMGRSDKVFNVGFGSRIDMRLLREHDGHFLPASVESWMYEPWTPKAAKADETAN